MINWGALRKWATLEHKCTFLKVGHIGKVGHIWAQIYIGKSGGNEVIEINEVNELDEEIKVDEEIEVDEEIKVDEVV